MNNVKVLHFNPHDFKSHCQDKGAVPGLSPRNFHIFPVSFPPPPLHFFFNSNNADGCIKDGLVVNDAMIMHDLLPCSVGLARQLHHPHPCHVIFSLHFLGDTEATQGDTFINGDDSGGISTSVHTNIADISASLINTARVVQASRWQNKRKKKRSY